MSTTVETPRTGGGTSGVPGQRSRARGLGLSGMVWLVWRQHRTAFVLLLVTAAVTTAGLAWLAQEASHAVAAVEGPDPSPGAEAALTAAYSRLDMAGLAMTGLPVIIGVFFGAPLFAGDLESGTAKFVALQSRSRWNWVATKLGITALFVAAAALSTGIAMKAMLTPLVNHLALNADFTGALGFDPTGQVAVAFALLGLLIGATAGLLVRRTLPAMVTTFGAMLAVKIIWSQVRMIFATTVTRTTGGGRFGDTDLPRIPVNALEIDTSYVIGDGSLRGRGMCLSATEEAKVACLRREGVVGWSTEYLPFSHMDAMQWAATGALAGLILLTAGLLVYAARRALR